MVLPFLLLALYLVYSVLGSASAEPAVRLSLLVEVGIGLLRWGILAVLAPPAGQPAPPASTWRMVLNGGAAWMVSAGMANIYVAATPFASSTQLLELALIATGICTLAMLSMASTVEVYVGFIAINYGALAVAITRHADPALLPLVPGMMGMFSVALAIIAIRNRAALRDKIVLTLELRESALRDALTGLRNRAFAVGFAEQRSMQVLSQWRVGRGRRQPSTPPTLAFFLIDLDHFKAVNDTHGHAAGDEVLAAFARLAQSSLRAEDVVARWGGEEFLVVMEVSDCGAAHAAAERLRKLLVSEAIALPGGASVPVTCSIGACLLPLDPAQPDALTWQETVELADGALYRAKHGGRNRTMWASAGPHGLPRAALDALRAKVAADATEQELAPQTTLS